MVTLDTKTFDDLAVIAIYHLTDVCYRSRANAALRRLKRQNVLHDPLEAYENYEKLVCEYAESILPSGYSLQYDYWGAKGYSRSNSWSATKTSFFGGDQSGCVMFFDSHEVMVAYGEECLEEIAKGNDR
jgi:hypothetical protein